MEVCSTAKLRSLVEPNFSNTITIERQCDLLGLSKSTYYYEPKSERAENLLYMRLMDEQYMKTPFYGVGQMTYFLRRAGHPVNPKRVRRLLRLMGLQAICPGPHTSKPGKTGEHQIFPYLLRKMSIERVGQVVGVDITYIPMQKGFLYLVAFIDWYSRYVLSWELSNTLESSFCIQALQMIWSMLDVEIINSDQGAQFTSKLFVDAVLSQQGVRFSMDGKGRAIDNVFTERLWRNVKYEKIYLNEYLDGIQVWKALEEYFKYYNEERPNSKLDGHTPSEIFTGMYKAKPIKIKW